MTRLLLFIFLITAAFTEKGCRNKKKAGHSTTGCYKGKLAVKANCMNYTISVTGGNMDSSLIETLWTDESTGQKITNAFALESKCNFPDSIKEGDEFYFVLDSTVKQDCAVCMMYYPVPSKKLSIRVINEPCPQ